MRSAWLLLALLVIGGCATVHPDPNGWHDRDSGPGWRLLARETLPSPERAYVVHAATDLAEYRELWSEIGFAGPRPEVDLDHEIVVSFAHGIGSSCPEMRLDDVVIDGSDVYSVASDPIVDAHGSPRLCTADLAGAVTFVVAVERDALPGEAVMLWLSDAARIGRLNSEPLRVRVP
jgi:hypothetical protein